MSMVTEKVGPHISTPSAPAASLTAQQTAETLNLKSGTASDVPEKKRRRKRPYKAYMATKVKWALGDCMEKTIAAQRHMRNVLDWVERMRRLRAEDTGLMAQFGELDHEIAYLALDVSEMERIITQAIAEAKPQVEEKKNYRDLE